MTQPSPSPVPPSNSPVPGWLFLLLALGGPTALAAGFANQITSNPIQFAGIVVVYLLLLAVVGAVTKIWQNLEPRWVGPIADRIDSAVRTLFAGYRRRYLSYMIEQHRFFDVKGLTTQGPYSLRLEQVFVELSLAAETAHRSNANPIAVPDNLKTGQHTLWGFLQAPTLRGQHLVVLGAPGSGKSTLLRHVALALAAKQRLEGSRRAPNKLPILLFLRDHADTIKEKPNSPLPQMVADHLTRLHGPPPPPEWFEQQLQAGGCIVMLDGLDEVADPKARANVVQWVERQMTLYANNRFLITSRPFGYRSNPLERVAVLEIRPFTPVQIKRFVHNWYLANEIMSAQLNDPGVRRNAMLGADDLLQRLRTSASLADLAVNPLLLTMIANVHRYRSTLPGRRVELYAEICEVFLGKRQQARGIEIDLTPAQKQSVLQPLAYAMMQRQQREITLADALPIIRTPLEHVSVSMRGTTFLKHIEESSGLLLERESDVYSFAHLTFQEYLAAAHVREQHLETELVQQVNTSWWHETLRLYSAQADATAVIKACITEAHPSVEALTLVLECAEEARQINPAVRERLDHLVSTGLEDRDPVRPTPIAEALLAIRLRRMVQLDKRRAIDTTPVTCAEYQLFLDEGYRQRQTHQPDHWRTQVFPAGRARLPVTGIRRSDAIAFCEWLNQRESQWHYRLPTHEDLEQHPTISHTNIPNALRYVYWVGGEPTIYTAWSLNTSSDYIQQIISQQTEKDLRIGRFLSFGGVLCEIINGIKQDQNIYQTITKLLDYISKSIEFHYSYLENQKVKMNEPVQIFYTHLITDLGHILNKIQSIQRNTSEMIDFSNNKDLKIDNVIQKLKDISTTIENIFSVYQVILKSNTQSFTEELSLVQDIVHLLLDLTTLTKKRPHHNSNEISDTINKYLSNKRIKHPEYNFMEIISRELQMEAKINAISENMPYIHLDSINISPQGIIKDFMFISTISDNYQKNTSFKDNIFQITIEYLQSTNLLSKSEIGALYNNQSQKTRQYLRLLAMTIVISLSNHYKHPASFRQNKDQNTLKHCHNLYIHYLKIYTQLSLLESRINQDTEAIEAFLLYRHQK